MNIFILLLTMLRWHSLTLTIKKTIDFRNSFVTMHWSFGLNIIFSALLYKNKFRQYLNVL